MHCTWEFRGITDDIDYVEAEIMCHGQPLYAVRLHRETLEVSAVLCVPVDVKCDSLMLTTVTFCNKKRNITTKIGKTDNSATDMICLQELEIRAFLIHDVLAVNCHYMQDGSESVHDT